MSRGLTWWRAAGRMLDRHPELLDSARGVRGFGAGARWMHGAMSHLGWRMPPFRGGARHAGRGWLKYGVCGIFALLPAVAAVAGGVPWIAPVLLVAGFYAAEAQMVFLFPEALLGRRVPWRASRAMTVAAGGTARVMATVLPIAAGMLATGWWRGTGHRSWTQGCLAVVLWHRQVAKARREWVEEPEAGDLPAGEIGPVNPVLLRRETVPRAGAPGFRVLWISDLHWRGEGDAGMLLALIRIARRERPDVCVLGGDFLESGRALHLFALLVRVLARMGPCVALPGNHDLGSFRSRIRGAVVAGGGMWLPDKGRIVVSRSSGEGLAIVGAEQAAEAGTLPALFVAHDPAELEGVSLPAGSIVMAGHLHGGQIVLSARNRRLLPAAWFYRHAWLRRCAGGVEWIVSRGAGDTVPLRWNCPREVILCEIG